MNIEAYKSSGKLEEYLLGLLSESEAREVEQVAAAYPEIKAELNAMEDALTQYALAKGIPMPEELPARIMRRLETLDKEVPPTKTTPPKSGTGGGGGPILPLLGFLLAASLAGLLYFWFQKSELEQDLNQSQTDLQELQENCDEVQDSLDQTTLQLAILRSDGNRTYIMRGTDNNPGAIANVYYNPQAQNAYLDIRELPAPPTGQQYQLWGIGADGVPQSMDVFDIPAGGGIEFIPVPYLPDVNVFAVSLEPAGGSPSPTAVHLISG